MGKNRNKFWGFIGGVLQSLIAAAIIALPGFLAWIQEMPWFVIPLSILLAACLSIFAINQWAAWKKGKGLSKLSDKELEVMIRDWTDIPGYKFRRESAEPGLFFKFLIEDKYDRGLNIMRYRSFPQGIRLASGMIISQKGKSIPHSDLEKLSDKFSLEMARLGIEFDFDGKPDPLGSIRVSKTVILDDSLTMFRFRQEVAFILRALVLINVVAKQSFGTSGQSSGASLATPD